MSFFYFHELSEGGIREKIEAYYRHEKETGMRAGKRKSPRRKMLMNAIDTKIKEIASGYAALTGRPPGWEAYISLQDYAVLREMAAGELARGMPLAEITPVPAAVQDKTVKTAAKAKKEQETKTEGNVRDNGKPYASGGSSPTSLSSDGKGSLPPTHAMTDEDNDNETNSPSELDLLISLGEG